MNIFSSIVCLVLFCYINRVLADLLSLTCDEFCVSKPARCTCQANGGSFNWIVRYPNGSIAAFDDDDDESLNVPYPLNGSIGAYFISTLTATNNSVMTGNILFTPNNSYSEYYIICHSSITGHDQVQIKFKAVPSAPVELYPMSFTNESFHLSWSPPLNSSQCVSYYTINSSVPVSPMITTFASVTCNTTASSDPFNISVAGVDYGGRKGPSTRLICIKLSRPGLVTGLSGTIVPRESYEWTHQVIIYFTFPEFSCYPDISSHILITNLSYSGDTTTILPSPTSTATLLGAVERSTYTVQVVASNELGLGPTTTTTIDIPVPSEFINIISSGSPSSSFDFESSSIDIFPSMIDNCTNGAMIVREPNALSIGFLILGFIGGMITCVIIIYLYYCYNETRRKRAEAKLKAEEEEKAELMKDEADE